MFGLAAALNKAKRRTVAAATPQRVDREVRIRRLKFAPLTTSLASPLREADPPMRLSSLFPEIPTLPTA